MYSLHIVEKGGRGPGLREALGGATFGPLDSIGVSFLENLVVGPDDFPNPTTRRRNEDLIVPSKGPSPLTNS